ncbi:hypothetical protein PNH50_12380 [Leisingera aquaemixtae]|uniref:hypothetical protein n=1 Tax=Leisingera aquaemixtae TaxID=1396826 RepID=UPI003984402C
MVKMHDSQKSQRQSDVSDDVGEDQDKAVGTVVGPDDQAGHEDLIRRLTTPGGWSVPVAQVANQSNIRLDAEHYDPIVMKNDKELRSLGVSLVPLSDLADVQLPSMFTRIWAKDASHGVPYLNATDLMSYFALGVPAQERYLSHASDVKMENLLVKTGMILITCSGTIGRVFDVPASLDGWAGTHDLVRVTPYNPEMKGFLRAYLASRFAQVQILSHTHGGQIDHVTAEQVGSCLVPDFGEHEIRRISQIADKADNMRSDGTALMNDAIAKLSTAPNYE